MEKVKFEKEVSPFLKRIYLHVNSLSFKKDYEGIDKVLDIKCKILDEAFLEGNEEVSFESIVKKYIPNYFKETNIKNRK